MKSKYNLDLKEGIDFQVKEYHWLPRKLNVDYFAFRKILFCRYGKGKLPKHEFLHLVQFKEYGTLAVLIHYVYYGTKNLFKYRRISTAFQEIPFEIEARSFASETEGE